MRIICELAWKSGSSVNKIITLMKQIANSAEDGEVKFSQKQNSKLFPFNCFFKRVLQASASTIVELCQLLHVDDQIQEIIWSVMKSLMSSAPDLLINRHLDQLVMCTIYSVAKISDMRHLTFNNIINKYAHLYKNKEYVTQIYTQCVINQETLETKDIINFYNQIYLAQMKQHIILYKEQIKTMKAAKNAAMMQSQEGQQQSRTPMTTNPNMKNSEVHQKITVKTAPVLTPQNSKAFVRAFCTSVPLHLTYASKQRSNARVIFQRGSEDQLIEGKGKKQIVLNGQDNNTFVQNFDQVFRNQNKREKIQQQENVEPGKDQQIGTKEEKNDKFMYNLLKSQNVINGRPPRPSKLNQTDTSILNQSNQSMDNSIPIISVKQSQSTRVNQENGKNENVQTSNNLFQQNQNDTSRLNLMRSNILNRIQNNVANYQNQTINDQQQKAREDNKPHTDFNIS